MERFFDEETGHVCRLIQHTGLVPQHLVMALPGVLRYRRLLELSPSGCRFVFRVSRALFVSPMYVQPQLHGTSCTT